MFMLRRSQVEDRRERSLVLDGTTVVFEVYDTALPPPGYVGSLPLTRATHSRLIAALTWMDVIRSLHVPCHGPDALLKACDHQLSDPPLCRECGTDYPCRTREATGG